MSRHNQVLIFFTALSSLVSLSTASDFRFLCSFFSEAVFFKPFIFRVCNLSIFCFGMWICPCWVPNVSFEIFLTFFTYHKKTSHHIVYTCVFELPVVMFCFAVNEKIHGSYNTLYNLFISGHFIVWFNILGEQLLWNLH